MTDPPYYDAVPYADLSDFFYVWHKRALHNRFPDLYRTPLTPKAKELVQQSEKVTSAARRKKDRTFFEEGMTDTFREMRRVVSSSGLVGVMFAHKTTTAWEALIQGLTRAGFSVSSSWPIHTEMKARLRAREAAALASSVLLLCRKRPEDAADGYWDDVRNELRVIARERLDFFWKQGIRGADFFISAIGPALSVFGRYTRVTRLSSEEVTVGQFLDEVRQIVTDYALSQILHGVKTGQIDPETRFHVLWKWSYGDAKVPADEAFKLAQALGIPTEQMWDKTGVLEKAGENVLALPITKRMRIKDLGDPNVDGSPASTIDVLHRCCGYRDRGDTAGLAEFLGRSGHAKSEKLWTVAQAISEVLPDGDKEKQLLQGLLNQRERVEKDMATLFTV
jgi:adenine-specific DNA methylase